VFSEWVARRLAGGLARRSFAQGGIAMRPLVFVLALGGLLVPAGRLLAVHDGEILSDTWAARYGLTRPWVAQVQMDRGRGRVRDVILYGGTLYVQTSRAMIHAIDAETGQTLWAKQVGRPEYPSLTPNAFHDLLATVNGSRLYVVNRYNGDVLYETQIQGAPGAGPALSSKRCYVPTVVGMMLAYRVEPLTDPLAELGRIEKKEPTAEEKKAQEEERRQNIRVNQDYVPPFATRSVGRVLVPPLVTLQNRDEEFSTWGTDRGFLNIGRVDRSGEDNLDLKHQFRTGQAIVATPSYLPPDPKVVGDSGTIYATSCDGYVYAVLEKSGELLWKFSAGEPVVEPAVLIEERLFAPTQLGGMYCLDAKSGRQLWWAPDIRRFLAASRQRVYGADKVGRIRILDGKSGALLDTLPTESLPLAVTNSLTDRLYVGTDTGLLECLHELEQPKPLQYGESRKPPPDDVLPKPPKPKPSAEGGAKPEKPAAKPRPAPTPKPKVTPKKKKSDDAAAGDDAAADDLPKTKPARDKKAKPLKNKKGKQDDDTGGGGDSPF
jgi:outer membrane biosynthesis protein TonB